MMQDIRSLYGSTMDGLKMEQNKGIIILTGIDIMSIIIIISLVIHAWSFKKLFGVSDKYKKIDW